MFIDDESFVCSVSCVGCDPCRIWRSFPTQTMAAGVRKNDQRQDVRCVLWAIWARQIDSNGSSPRPPRPPGCRLFEAPGGNIWSSHCAIAEMLALLGRSPSPTGRYMHCRTIFPVSFNIEYHPNSVTIVLFSWTRRRYHSQLFRRRLPQVHGWDQDQAVGDRGGHSSLQAVARVVGIER